MMAALLGASVMLAGAGGCDSLFGRVSYNGQSYTPEQLRAAIEEDNARRTRDAEREAQAAAAESAERAAQAAADAAKRSADFELAVTRIEGDAKTAVMELRAKYEQDAALASAAWTRLEAQAREQIERIRQDAIDDNTARTRSAERSIAKFESERGMLGQIFTAAEAGAGASGIPLLSLGIATIGGIFGLTGRKTAALNATNAAQAQSAITIADLKAAVEKARAEGEAKGWDDGVAHTNAEVAKRDATWDDSKRENVMNALLNAGASVLAKAAA